MMKRKILSQSGCSRNIFLRSRSLLNNSSKQAKAAYADNIKKPESFSAVFIFTWKGINKVGFTGILASVVIALAVIAIMLIVNGIQENNWKKVIITAVIFCIIIALMFLGLIYFITSM